MEYQGLATYEGQLTYLEDRIRKMLVNCKISGRGIDIVLNDPGLGRETIQKLINADAGYLDEEMRNTILTPKEIAAASNDMLLGNNETGYATLVSCILEDEMQTPAELVARFLGGKKHIPYVYAAVLLRSFYNRRGFEYIKRIGKSGTGKLRRWHPADMGSSETPAAKIEQRIMPPI